MKAIKTTAQFDTWMASLKDRAAIARIRIRIDRLALGNPGQCRNLKGGVCELKVDFGPAIASISPSGRLAKSSCCCVAAARGAGC
jgi:putative addiction module killer protein